MPLRLQSAAASGGAWGRFKIGETVRIRPTIMSRYLGAVGRVVQIMPNKRGKATLDKYIVEFDDGRRATFWDIQIEKGGKGETPPGL